MRLHGAQHRVPEVLVLVDLEDGQRGDDGAVHGLDDLVPQRRGELAEQLVVRGVERDGALPVEAEVAADAHLRRAGESEGSQRRVTGQPRTRAGQPRTGHLKSFFLRSFLYFSMYFETSSIGGPSLGSIFSKSINLLSYDN